MTAVLRSSGCEKSTLVFLSMRQHVNWLFTWKLRCWVCVWTSMYRPPSFVELVHIWQVSPAIWVPERQHGTPANRGRHTQGRGTSVAAARRMKKRRLHKQSAVEDSEYLDSTSASRSRVLCKSNYLDTGSFGLLTGPYYHESWEWGKRCWIESIQEFTFHQGVFNPPKSNGLWFATIGRIRCVRSRTSSSLQFLSIP